MKQLLTGNEAAAEAAIVAGCRYYYGYPITPQNELINYMSIRMPQVAAPLSRQRVRLPPLVWFTGALRLAVVQ